MLGSANRVSATCPPRDDATRRSTHPSSSCRHRIWPPTWPSSSWWSFLWAWWRTLTPRNVISAFGKHCVSQRSFSTPTRPKLPCLRACATWLLLMRGARWRAVKATLPQLAAAGRNNTLTASVANNAVDPGDDLPVVLSTGRPRA